MIRAGTVDEVLSLRESQAKRTPFPWNTPNPTFWRLCDRGEYLVGAYGYMVLPGHAVFVMEILVDTDGFEGKRACVEMNADMTLLAQKEGLSLVTTVPVQNGAMVKAAESTGWRVTHIMLEREA